MTFILATTRTHHEFATADAIVAAGGHALVPREAELVRLPKQRRPTIVERPYLPGYIFLSLTPAQWHQIKKDGKIHFTPKREILPAEWDRYVTPFVQHIETFYQYCMEDIDRQMAEIQRMTDEEVKRAEAILKLPKLNRGETIKLLGGIFAGQDAIFEGIDDSGQAPVLKVTIKGVQMFGKSVQIAVDPVDVRHAAE